MIFLPIKPKFALAIHEGQKKVEFRKINISKTLDKYCIVYASSPIKKIIGYFELENVEIDSPDIIWKKYEKVGAISKKEFKNYYYEDNFAVALKIKKYIPFKQGIDPKEILEDFSIPQSFCYLKREQIKLIFPHLKKDLIPC